MVRPASDPDAEPETISETNTVSLGDGPSSLLPATDPVSFVRRAGGGELEGTVPNGSLLQAGIWLEGRGAVRATLSHRAESQDFPTRHPRPQWDSRGGAKVVTTPEGCPQRRAHRTENLGRIGRATASGTLSRGGE